MNKYLIVISCFIWMLVSGGIVFADEPGNWLQNLRESKESFAKAGDKGLKLKVIKTRDALERGGCADNTGAVCEKKRSEYLAAAKDYLLNAYKYLDQAVRSGDSALTGYRKDGKTSRTLESIKGESTQSHNNIAKMILLQDAAIFYDPDRPKIITREALRGLSSLELGLDKDMRNFTDKKVDIDSYTLVLRALLTGVRMRLGLIKQAAVLGSYRTTMQMLCLENKNADECSSAEVDSMVTAVMSPVEDMGLMTPRPHNSQRETSTYDDEIAKKHYSNYR